MNSPQDPLVETRKIGSWSVVAGIALLLSIALMVVLSRSGENKLLSDGMLSGLGHPRAATVDEQREFVRLSLQGLLESSDKKAPTPSAAPRLALNALPIRLCIEMPTLRACSPNAVGRLLMSETLPEESKNLERVPIALRRVLVQAKPAADHLPDPGIPGVVTYNDGAPLPPEKERLVLALVRGRQHGGYSHAMMTWAAVSTDGRTAVMDVTATGTPNARGYTALEVFERDAQGWRLADRAMY